MQPNTFAISPASRSLFEYCSKLRNNATKIPEEYLFPPSASRRKSSSNSDQRSSYLEEVDVEEDVFNNHDEADYGDASDQCHKSSIISTTRYRFRGEYHRTRFRHCDIVYIATAPPHHEQQHLCVPPSSPSPDDNRREVEVPFEKGSETKVPRSISADSSKQDNGDCVHDGAAVPMLASCSPGKQSSCKSPSAQRSLSCVPIELHQQNKSPPRKRHKSEGSIIASPSRKRTLEEEEEQCKQLVEARLRPCECGCRDWVIQRLVNRRLKYFRRCRFDLQEEPSPTPPTPHHSVDGLDTTTSSDKKKELNEQEEEESHDAAYAHGSQATTRMSISFSAMAIHWKCPVTFTRISIPAFSTTTLRQQQQQHQMMDPCSSPAAIPDTNVVSSCCGCTHPTRWFDLQNLVHLALTRQHNDSLRHRLSVEQSTFREDFDGGSYGGTPTTHQRAVNHDDNNRKLRLQCPFCSAALDEDTIVVDLWMLQFSEQPSMPSHLFNDVSLPISLCVHPHLAAKSSPLAQEEAHEEKNRSTNGEQKVQGCCSSAALLLAFAPPRTVRLQWLLSKFAAKVIHHRAIQEEVPPEPNGGVSRFGKSRMHHNPVITEVIEEAEGESAAIRRDDNKGVSSLSSLAVMIGRRSVITIDDEEDLL